MPLLNTIGNNISSVWNGSFSIANSFLLDGVDESFTAIAHAKINPYVTGTNKQFTVLFSFKRNSGLGVLKIPFGNYNGTAWSMIIEIETNNSISLYQRDVVTTKQLGSSASSVGSAGVWYNVAFVIDGVTPSNSKILVNDVDVTGTNTLSSNATILANDFAMGQAGNNTLYTAINVLQKGLIDRVLTPTETTNWYNLGKPKSPELLFGTDCKMFLNPDNSGATAPFTITDSVNSVTATSVNMETADKTTDTPY